MKTNGYFSKLYREFKRHKPKTELSEIEADTYRKLYPKEDYPFAPDTYHMMVWGADAYDYGDMRWVHTDKYSETSLSEQENKIVRFEDAMRWVNKDKKWPKL